MENNYINLQIADIKESILETLNNVPVMIADLIIDSISKELKLSANNVIFYERNEYQKNQKELSSKTEIDSETPDEKEEI
ncbi:MAG: hypothetical protein K1W19_04210 [Lachnospiraceae bacterium]